MRRSVWNPSQRWSRPGSTRKQGDYQLALTAISEVDHPEAVDAIYHDHWIANERERVTDEDAAETSPPVLSRSRGPETHLARR